MKIVLATRNRHKVDEIRAILNVPGLELTCAADFPNAPDVVEDGDTFKANAIKKAVALARATGLPSLADDSGLEVDALGGAPGVRSARYAGEPSNDKANVRKLLTELSGSTHRRARFQCVLALADPSGGVKTVEGACAGVIAPVERGHQGFGYDPVFVPDGFKETFAEMEPAQKNRLSHRARALEKLKVLL
jgi:XTP/dITP diphosphohydrolase